MAAPKTKPTKVSVRDFIKKVPDKKRREDSDAVLKLMQEVTGAAPEMWAPASSASAATGTSTTAAGKGSGC